MTRRANRIRLCAAGGYQCYALPGFVLSLLKHFADDVQVVLSRAAIARSYLLELQDRITSACMAVDGKPFVADKWKKNPDEPLQGEGITKILEDGTVFERAG